MSANDDRRYSCFCPKCGRWVKAMIPRGGDGSAVKPYRHKNGKREWCGGWTQITTKFEVSIPLWAGRD